MPAPTPVSVRPRTPWAVWIGWLVVTLAAAFCSPTTRLVAAQSSVAEARLARVLARGEQQLARSQWRAADRTFTLALELDATSVAGITGLARALLPSIETQTSRATVQQVRGAERVLVALNGANELARAEELQRVEATALVVLGRQREALAVLARPPRIATAALVPTLDALALLAAERDDLACAEDALRLALELEPTAARALRLSDVLMARGGAVRAVPLLFAALRFEGESIPLHLALARAQLAAGDASGADTTLRRVITRCPRHCGLLRARVALESGQVARAAELARGLLTLAPDTAEATAAGAEGAPDHRAEAGYLLGLALARDGQRDDAREALEEALRRDPTHRGARQMLHALEPSAPE